MMGIDELTEALTEALDSNKPPVGSILNSPNPADMPKSYAVLLLTEDKGVEWIKKLESAKKALLLQAIDWNQQVENHDDEGATTAWYIFSEDQQASDLIESILDATNAEEKALLEYLIKTIDWNTAPTRIAHQDVGYTVAYHLILSDDEPVSMYERPKFILNAELIKKIDWNAYPAWSQGGGYFRVSLASFAISAYGIFFAELEQNDAPDFIEKIDWALRAPYSELSAGTGFANSTPATLLFQSICDDYAYRARTDSSLIKQRGGELNRFLTLPRATQFLIAKQVDWNFLNLKYGNGGLSLLSYMFQYEATRHWFVEFLLATKQELNHGIDWLAPFQQISVRFRDVKVLDHVLDIQATNMTCGESLICLERDNHPLIAYVLHQLENLQIGAFELVAFCNGIDFLQVDGVSPQVEKKQPVRFAEIYLEMPDDVLLQLNELIKNKLAFDGIKQWHDKNTKWTPLLKLCLAQILYTQLTLSTDVEKLPDHEALLASFGQLFAYLDGIVTPNNDHWIKRTASELKSKLVDLVQALPVLAKEASENWLRRDIEKLEQSTWAGDREKLQDNSAKLKVVSFSCLGSDLDGLALDKYVQRCIAAPAKQDQKALLPPNQSRMTNFFHNNKRPHPDSPELHQDGNKKKSRRTS